jgi:pimeloyl-ACP methyl ester carboxylesterase
VLRFDDRGFAQSGGDLATATTADFATDAAVAVDYLRNRKEIDPEKIGLAGHSEGGLIAFIAAQYPSEVAFVVSMAGPGVRGDSLSVMQFEDIISKNEVSADDARTMVSKQRENLTLIFGHKPEYIEANLDAIAEKIAPGFSQMNEDMKNSIRANIRSTNSPWWRFFAMHDPAEDIEKIKCPVLILNGDKDLQVRASVNTEAIRTALERGGNHSSTVIVYPGLNHLFQTSETGRIDEYGELEETFSPKVMEDIAGWILKITK